ncbi:MAG: hypothetical protein H8E83_00250 [Planctomycetes bacterium]|nr:hypothetical protein [Planctomycetota bacterium]
MLTALFVALLALLLWFGIAPSGEESGDYSESFWKVLTVALSPEAAEELGWLYRLVMLLVAVIGILIVSTLIGVLTARIEAKFESLRRGRSLVIEKNHIVVLGWSSKIYTVLEELSCANENQRNACVVILADKDKVDMEEAIADNINTKSFISFVCRTGNPTRISDVKIVNPTQAKSVIVLQDINSGSDSTCLKVCLALMRVFGGDITCPVAVEMQDVRSVDALLRIDSDIQAVRSGNIIARVLVQASRQPGLSDVYDEVMSFHGGEIYFFPPSKVVGYTVGNAMLALENCSLIGLFEEGRNIILNPSAEQVIRNTDKLIVIAEDDIEVVLRDTELEPLTTQIQRNSETPKPESVLIVGWHQDANIFVNELQKLLPKNSSVLLMFDTSKTDGPDEAALELGTLAFTLMQGETTQRSFLESADLETFDHIVVLGYSDSLGVNDADGESLLTLIQLRDLIQSKDLDVNIACELLNTHNRELVATEQNEDYVASEDLVAKNLVQIAENEHVEKVFKTLLTADDSEFHMRSICNYLEPNNATEYAQVVANGLPLNEMVIGYRKDGVCVLNPCKSDKVALNENDSIIVLAEE